MTSRTLALTLLSLVLLGSSAAAETSDVAIPPELQEWVPWVLHQHEDLDCPIVGSTRLCAWPGRLELKLEDGGGDFSMEVHADRELDLALPGDATHWPRDVKVDGRSGTVTERSGSPAVRLAAGTHRIAGRFSWTRLPESLAVPDSIALLDVTVRGEAIASPRRQDNGHLWLQGSRSDTALEDRLTLEVHRRVEDGVPVTLTTRLRLRVSGSAREQDLGVPLPEGMEPISISSSMPVRLDGQGHLHVQLRPGDQTITLKARSTGPVSQLAMLADENAVWPSEEVWVFAASPTIRTVRIEGALGVDPQRTSLDSDWHGLPAYLLQSGSELRFVELRRGEAAPPPDSVTVRRELWLSPGGALVVRDSLAGRIQQGGRLELHSPGELGHVAVGGQERVINHRVEGEERGVEIRDGTLQVEAELSYPDGRGIPAVGWDRDASSLSATLHLPPGWQLLGTTGVDSASDTWLARWSLLDLFFLLLITIVTAQLMSWRWGLVAALGLGLAWHEPTCPQASWLVLLAAHALVGALRDGWLNRALRALRWLVVGVLALQLLVFSWGQVRTGVFPQLAQGGAGPYDVASYGSNWGGRAEAVSLEMGMAPKDAFDMDDEGQIQQQMEPAPSSGRGRRYPNTPQAVAPKKRSAQVDPQAVVQTGPGIPRWQWNRYSLSWSGPVSSSHSMSLLLLPPWANLLLAILRVLALVLLGLRFCDPRRNPGPKPDDSPQSSAAAPPALAGGAAVLLLSFALLAPSQGAAEELPSQTLLDELESRLVEPPDCSRRTENGNGCLVIQAMRIQAGARLRIELEVHALARTALRLPGPDSAWVPASVTLDGQAARALRRQDDGFLALRVEAGLHRVVLSGPARDEVPLSFPQVPEVLEWQGDGWTIDGYRSDAQPPPSVQLHRSRPLTAQGGDEDENLELPPWLELRRELDIGIPWLVHNELVRLGPPGSVVHVQVPLLDGESVTSPGIVVKDGQASVTLEGSETLRSWDSTLAEVSTLSLVAPQDSPWMERWELDCSPIWSCSAGGLAPIEHMSSGTWRPSWQPWPGESIELSFAKPTAASGATRTIDSASLVLSPGRRVLEATLSFELRSSQGGEQVLQLPADARVLSLKVGGRDLPIELVDGQLTFGTEPGKHDIELRWRQERESGLVVRSPAVSLGSAGANATVTIHVPENKWLLWAGGPPWGAVVTLWQHVLVLLLVAWLLGRFAPTKLKVVDWFVLGLGMTQVPLAAPVIVLLWLLLLGLRGQDRDLLWWRHDLLQVTIAGWTLLALVMMYWAVYEGLLFQPDMQVAGAGSYGETLHWYQPRMDGELAQPWVLWLPLWVWRVTMLLWALWLSVKVFTWLKWGWQQFSVGGLWKAPPASAEAEVPAPSEAAASEPTPSPQEG